MIGSSLVRYIEQFICNSWQLVLDSEMAEHEQNKWIVNSLVERIRSVIRSSDKSIKRIVSELSDVVIWQIPQNFESDILMEMMIYL